MEASQTLFLMHIMHGYSFRNTIGLIKSEIDIATMVLSPKTITISFVNSSGCANHKITLYTDEFTLYQYNIRDDKGELIPEYAIAFEMDEMANSTKGIGRRDGIRLYWLAGSDKISVQPVKTSTRDPGSAGALFVKILNIEYKRYEIPSYYAAEPNVRVQAKDFASVCTQANTSRCSALEIVGHPNSVTFRAMQPNNTMAAINRFTAQTEATRTVTSQSNMNQLDNLLANIRVSDNIYVQPSCSLSLNVIKREDLMTVRVPIATVKALSKIHNISPDGTLIRFYFLEAKPTKLESPIGTYGLYVICLRNARC